MSLYKTLMTTTCLFFILSLMISHKNLHNNKTTAIKSFSLSKCMPHFLNFLYRHLIKKKRRKMNIKKKKKQFNLHIR